MADPSGVETGAFELVERGAPLRLCREILTLSAYPFIRTDNLQSCLTTCLKVLCQAFGFWSLYRLQQLIFARLESKTSIIAE
jgi:hypothetical protein